ncbi:MAG: PQQ-dependent sugar dehydrogenase [bacterium]|nr:PQQ-dependent sugar dehydrogenase [bacterium]
MKRSRHGSESVYRLGPTLARVLIILILPILWSPAGAAQTVGTTRIADGLASPTYVVSPPDDFNRVFVTERLTGNIRIMELTTATFHATPFLTVSGVTGEGLQGLAFHPNYSVNGFFYVYYFASSPSRTVVERYTRDSTNPDLADSTSGLTIIEIPQPAGNHNGGWLGFGPDGLLYVPQGDGGGQCDPDNNGQNTNTLLSSVLRLDVDRDDFPTDPDRNYGIPPGNPFVGQAGADEIWSYGLRNPFRSSFDRSTGDFYIGDVGQSTREEINFQPASNNGGDNYGWDLREGELPTPTATDCAGGPPPPGNVDPLYAYAHGSGASQGNSVTGGYVYRGPETEIEGKYFFADFVNERIWSIDAGTGANLTDRTTAFVPDVGSINQIVSFGEDGFGNLYIVDLGGEIFRVDGPVGFVPCPDLLLSEDAVMGTEIIEHCRNITLGPNFTVGAGGDLTLRVGNKVTLRNGTTVAGLLTVEIDPALQQTPP